jgi:flagellar basal body-associated protein FliL
MNQTPKPHTLNSVLIVLLLPAMTFLCLIGWSLYWMGSNKMRTKHRKKYGSKELEATLKMLEEEYLAARATCSFIEVKNNIGLRE